MDRVELKCIAIRYSEGRTSYVDQYLGTYATWRAANDALSCLAREAPDSGGYNKTDVLVTWADGQEYEARVDLVRADALRCDVLVEHIRSHCVGMSGRKCPGHLAEDRWLAYINAIEKDFPGTQRGAADILDKYLPAPPSAAPPPAAPPEPEQRSADAPAWAYPASGKGHRYDATKELGVTEIAKLVRADIAAAVKGGTLPAGTKASVRISRYSMGQSITVHVTECPAVVLNAARVLAGDSDLTDATRCLYSPEGMHVLEIIERILGAYDWDRSRIEDDYHSCKFHAHVSFAHTLEESQRAAILAGGGK